MKQATRPLSNGASAVNSIQIELVRTKGRSSPSSREGARENVWHEDQQRGLGGDHRPFCHPVPTITYEPVEDVLKIALSQRRSGIHVYEVDDGLYAYIDDTGTVTHICAEQAALGRSESWRQQLGGLAGSGALRALDGLAISGEPVFDRVFEFTSGRTGLSSASLADDRR